MYSLLYIFPSSLISGLSWNIGWNGCFFLFQLLLRGQIWTRHSCKRYSLVMFWAQIWGKLLLDRLHLVQAFLILWFAPLSTKFFHLGWKVNFLFVITAVIADSIPFSFFSLSCLILELWCYKDVVSINLIIEKVAYAHSLTIKSWFLSAGNDSMIEMVWL